jgi:hypothetical protein
MEQELGVPAVFPFAGYLSELGSTSTVRVKGKPAVEVGRTQIGVTVRQLVEMRRQDGQARALYRLLTLPIRAALKTSTVVPADDAADKSQGDELDSGAPEGEDASTTDPTLPPDGTKPAAPATGPATGKPSGKPAVPGPVVPGKPLVGQRTPDHRVFGLTPLSPLVRLAVADALGTAPPSLEELVAQVDGTPLGPDGIPELPKPGEEEATFIDQMLTLPPSAGGMTVTWDRAVSQMLMAVFDGFAPFECVYWTPNKGPLKGKIALKKLSYRPADTVTFLADEHGGFAGLRQRTTFQGRAIDATIEQEHSFYYAANEEENPFYGVSYFQAAHYHHDKKIKCYYLAHLAAQVRAVGTRIGEMPANPSAPDRAAFRTALADFGAAQAMLVPFGYKVTSWSPTSNFDYMALISHHNSQMSKSVLAQFFDENDGSRTSLVDFSENNSSLFFLMLQAIMNEIEANINNYLIPKFIDWNFGTSAYPTFRFGPFTDEQKKAINDTFNALAVLTQPGVTPEFMLQLERHMAEEMGLEIDYDAIEAKQKEQEAATVAQGNTGPVFGVGPDGQPMPLPPVETQFGQPGVPQPLPPQPVQAQTAWSAAHNPQDPSMVGLATNARELAGEFVLAALAVEASTAAFASVSEKEDGALA